MVPLHYYLIVAAVLFGFGLFGALRQSNVIRILMSIEIMLNAVNLNLVAFSRYQVADPVRGQVFALFVIAVAAASAAVGLAIVLMIVRNQDDIDINDVNLLRG